MESVHWVVKVYVLKAIEFLGTFFFWLKVNWNFSEFWLLPNAFLLNFGWIFVINWEKLIIVIIRHICWIVLHWNSQSFLPLLIWIEIVSYAFWLRFCVFLNIQGCSLVSYTLQVFIVKRELINFILFGLTSSWFRQNYKRAWDRGLA